jgi:hypothetical protein
MPSPCPALFILIELTVHFFLYLVWLAFMRITVLEAQSETAFLSAELDATRKEAISGNERARADQVSHMP